MLAAIVVEETQVQPSTRERPSTTPQSQQTPRVETLSDDSSEPIADTADYSEAWKALRHDCAINIMSAMEPCGSKMGVVSGDYQGAMAVCDMMLKTVEETGAKKLIFISIPVPDLTEPTLAMHKATAQNAMPFRIRRPPAP